MPDWSYRTVLRPVLLALGPERSRRLTVFTLGTLSRVPFGLAAVDFLGHMRADPRLRTDAGAIELPGPIARGSLIDPAGQALPAFGRRRNRCCRSGGKAAHGGADSGASFSSS